MGYRQNSYKKNMNIKTKMTLNILRIKFLNNNRLSNVGGGGHYIIIVITMIINNYK